jgi:lysophospholipase L1-like esterase
MGLVKGELCYMKNIFIHIMISISAFSNAQSTDSQKHWANMEKYAADNVRIGLPLKGQKRIVFMGNSITEGWKIEDPAFFSTNTYVNRGISGQTTPQMLLRFRADVIRLQPAAVVILAGINDIAENTGPIRLEQVMDNIKSMAELARTHKIKVILCSVLPANKFPWRQEILPADKVIALNKMIRDYSIEKRITYVDYYSAMVDDKKGLDEKYTNDGVHPTLAGYKKMQDILTPVLKKAL